MISYDTYQNKIKRVAAVKNFIVRFRALFITLFAVLSALAITFICIKGMVTQDVVLPDKIVYYGDSYSEDIQAPKALFSDARYQFKRVAEEENAEEENTDTKRSVKYAVSGTAEAEEEWTYDLPTLAGKYLVRTVTRKTFGTSYGTPKTFEIEARPAQFVIESDSVVYGEIPDSYTFELINGDRLVADSIKLEYADPSLDVTYICNNAQSFKILDKYGRDVTFCYDITIPEKEIEILPKSITLTCQPMTAEYCGSGIDFVNALTATSLIYLNGDVAQVATEISDRDGNVLESAPVDAGTYTVRIIPDATVIKNGEADVVKHYNITYVASTFTINKRAVTITTPTDGKIYDGTPLVSDAVEYFNLVEGHTHVELYAGVTAIDAGTYDNVYVCAVFADGENVSDNYQLNYEYGRLTVAPRTVTIVTASDSKVYDGAELVNSDFTQEGLLQGHRLIPYYTGAPAIGAGAYENRYSYTVVGEDGENLTANYTFANNFGTLEIARREITVTSATASYIYDGTAQCAPEIESVGWTDEVNEGNPLADGEEIWVEQSTQVTFVTEGAVENNIVCKISKGGYDTTSNYNIRYINGTVKIEKRRITISTPSISKIYDGTALSGTAMQSDADNLAFGDALYKAENVVSITDCGTVTNELTFSIIKISFISSDITYTTENYDISYEYGTLQITQRYVTIYTPELAKVYDGTPLSGDGELPVVDNIAYGETVEAFQVVSITDAGERENTTQYRIYRTDVDYDYIPEEPPEDTNRRETTENYVITYVCGTLTVNKRYVSVLTASDSKEYDGTPLTHTDDWQIYEIPGASDSLKLVEGHTLVLDESQPYSSITDAGTIANDVHYKVMCGEENVSANYELAYVPGELTITRRIVRVVTADGEWVYRAEELSNPNISGFTHGSYSEDGQFVADGAQAFVLDHKLATYAFATIVNAGEVSNTCGYDVNDENGESVLYNYAIDMLWGTLIVKPRPVIITTHDGCREYDDTPFTHISAEAEEYDAVNERGILAGHEIVFDENGVTASVTFVTEGRVENELHYFIVDSAITKNYDVTYNYGSIYVTVRPLTIETATSSKEFDGEEYYDTSYYADGLVQGHELTAQDGFAKVTFVTEGQVKNEVVYRVIKNGEDLTENYEMAYEYGFISRTVRYLQITTNSHVWIYDGRPHSDAGYSAVHITDVTFDESGTVTDCVQDGEQGLVLGHKLVALNTVEVTDFSEIATPNEIVYIVENEEIDKNYSLIIIAGELSILRRPIIITTADAQRVYDGDPLTRTDGWSVKGDNLDWGLVEGHTLSVVGQPVQITDVLRENGAVVGIQNVVEYVVVDENGNNAVGNNYDIVRYEYGTLMRTPRPINIYTESDSKEYDGSALTCDKFSFEASDESNTRGLLTSKNHSVELDADKPVASITYITADRNGGILDSVENVRYYQIISQSGAVTDNYEINYVYGTLTISKRALTVKTITASKVYDGKYLQGDDESYGTPEFSGKVEGETYSAFNVAEIIDFNADGVENNTEYKLFDGGQETTYCYRIEYENGTLFIEKFEVIITTITASKVYDGEYLQGDDEDYGTLEFSDTIDGEFYKSDFVAKIIDSGQVFNDTTYSFYTYRDGKEVVTVNNYDIIYISGVLTVTPRPISVATATDTKVFDGNPLYNVKDYYLTQGELVQGHELTAQDGFAEVTYVTEGQVENKVVYRVIKNGEDLTKNYEITYFVDEDNEYGTLTVTKRTVAISTATKEHVYDGNAFSWTEDCVVEQFNGVRGLVSGYSARLVNENIPSVTDVADGEIENVLVFEIYDADSVDRTANFEIEYSYGTIKVTPRPLFIALNKIDKELIYNGEKVTADVYPLADGTMYTYEWNSSKTVEGQTLEITVKFQKDGDVEPVNAGTYSIVLAGYEIAGGSKDNYTVTATGSVLTIKALPITIKLIPPENKVYDGEAFAYPADGYEITEGSLLDGETLEIGVLYSGYTAQPIDAGKYVISLFMENCKVNGETALARNYLISCENVTYEIYVAKLSFDLEDAECVYDGYWHKLDLPANDTVFIVGSDYLEELTLLTTLSDGQQTEYVKDAGRYNYTVTNFKVFRDGKDVSYNYELSDTGNSAVLEIAKRQISVGVSFNGETKATHEYTGSIIDLKSLYNSPYGPYETSAINDSVNSFGISPADYGKINAVFSVTGAGTELKEYGKYDVFVALEGYEDNYEVIGTCTPAEFEITQRQIGVTLVWTDEVQLEYDGKPLDTSLFDYVTKHIGGQDEGFSPASDNDNYDVHLSLFGDDEEVDITDVLQAGNYCLKISLTLKEGCEDKYYIAEYNNLEFTVIPRTIQVKITDYATEYTYNGNAIDLPLTYVTTYDGSWTDCGFVADDEQSAQPIYEFNGQDCAVDAGEYTVTIARFENEYIARNYDVDFVEYDKITVNKAIVVVVPTSYTETYDGTKEILTLPYECYEIKYGQLFGNDSFSFTLSGKVDINVTYITYVRFTSVSVLDGAEDKTSNYDVVYTYTALKQKCPQLISELTSDKFNVELSFIRKQVHITQFALPEHLRPDIGLGEYAVIELDDTSIPSGCIGEGLEEGHVPYIAMAMVYGIQAPYIERWIQLIKVVDANGKDVSMRYEIIIDCSEDTFISVRAKEITVTVNCAPSAFAEGAELTSDDYSLPKNALLFGDKLSVTVEKVDGVLKYVAHIVTFDGNTDHGPCYIVNFEYPENNLEEAEYASRI